MADNVCGTVLVWRGEMESIVDGVRSAGGAGTSGSESGAESPQGESGRCAPAEQALLATETMVEGVSRAGIPDTPNGQDAADGLSGWADGAVDEIERAQDALGEETDSTSDELEQLADAVGTIVRCTRRAARPSPTPRSRTGAPHGARPVGDVRELGGELMTSMDWFLMALQGLIVIFFIFLGVRSGGSGSGSGAASGRSSSCSSSGSSREPPVSAMLIIIAVISAAAAMQAAGGIDYMVQIASLALRARPKALNFVALYVSYLLTILTGTGNTFFSIIPVINEVATPTRSGPSVHWPARRSRPRSGSRRARWRRRPRRSFRSSRCTATTSSTSCSSRSREHHRHPPMAFVMARHGSDLDDDVEYQRRLAAGEVILRPRRPRSSCLSSPSAAWPSSCSGSPRSASSASSRGSVRRSRRRRGGVEPMSITPLIQMFMLSAAALILCCAT